MRCGQQVVSCVMRWWYKTMDGIGLQRGVRGLYSQGGLGKTVNGSTPVLSKKGCVGFNFGGLGKVGPKWFSNWIGLDLYGFGFGLFSNTKGPVWFLRYKDQKCNLVKDEGLSCDFSKLQLRTKPAINHQYKDHKYKFYHFKPQGPILQIPQTPGTKTVTF